MLFYALLPLNMKVAPLRTSQIVFWGVNRRACMSRWHRETVFVTIPTAHTQMLMLCLPMLSASLQYQSWQIWVHLDSCSQVIPFKWSEVAQSCPTLCDPMGCSLPGSSIHGIFQAIVLEWIAISFSRGSSQPRDQTRVSRTAGRRFTIWATREILSNTLNSSKKIESVSLMAVSFRPHRL